MQAVSQLIVAYMKNDDINIYDINTIDVFAQNGFSFKGG